VTGAAPSAKSSARWAASVPDAARALAQSHIQTERAAPARSTSAPALSNAVLKLRRTIAARCAGAPVLPKAAEWFLDNEYLVSRAARQVDEEMPRGFQLRLPHLAAGADLGSSRCSVVARAIVADGRALLDLETLHRFIDAYQAVAPLTIAELWALPTMLRRAVLAELLGALESVNPIAPEAVATAAPAAARETAVQGPDAATGGVERCIHALRVLDTVDWSAFFERSNRVEAILRTDPAGVYPRMEFATCDAYRKVVESIAWSAGYAEEAVAKLAIDLARVDMPEPRRGHVGFYLVAEGRVELERAVGYRARGIERLRRAVTRWPTLAYLVPLVACTLASSAGVATHVLRDARPVWSELAPAILISLAAIVPLSGLIVTALQLAFAALLPPRTLPKLAFPHGLPAELRTVIAMPTLLGDAEEVVGMVRQIELHYLANPDPQLRFALLTDDVDATVLVDPAMGRTLLESASAGITALNAKYGVDGAGPFHLLHRAPRWNASEERFMGWERKRGKLEELNRLLRGATDTTFCRHVGDPDGLRGVHFVITLDSDTELPMESAHRLVGVLSHPLNRAVFDARGRVVSGYTIVQPRIETSPSTSRLTTFSRIFAGTIGFDIYTHASSELYQDLFGAGIYVGKGIYDVDAFMRSIDGRVPENALVSHDLFEGVQGRAALVTDIVLFESFPTSYVAYASRMHRWYRGDWQILPWVFSRVAVAGGSERGALAPIDRWKIADNLRRSLASPLLLLVVVLGWLCFPASAPWWTAGALLVLFASFLATLRPGRPIALETLARCGLHAVFLAFEASVAVDAVARVLVRKVITGKHLLQWTSAAHVARAVAAHDARALYWRTMVASPLLAMATTALLAWLRPSSLVAASPLLVAWLVAPEVARWMSRRTAPRVPRITDDDRRVLRVLARRTWRFFETFVGPNDQWLPVDNYQEGPREQTAHRTSPTNIGLSALATLSAYDFGYIGVSELALRMRRTFESIGRMQHHEGHLLNWYDTRNLEPLSPRYVSTVDSGNFAGCLLALKQGFHELASAPVVRTESWDGALDALDLLSGLPGLPHGVEVDRIRAAVEVLRGKALAARCDLDRTHECLTSLRGAPIAALERAVLVFLEAAGGGHDATLLLELEAAMASVRTQLQQMALELDALMPWLALAEDARRHGLHVPLQLRLDEVAPAARRLHEQLDLGEGERLAEGPPAPLWSASASRLAHAFTSAEARAEALLAELSALARRADEEVRGIDFELLYDDDRRLFHIGYNATSDQIDEHHYDLMASEARLASYLAIVKRDAPASHWFALGRQVTGISGSAALLSWGGTMFEYLMPNLLMRSREGTLLDRSSALAVEAQIAHARRGEPWGVSESAYARVDGEETYQYRSFGIPALGLKRGLEADAVVSPYASLLATSIRPDAVVANIVVLERMGALGRYGLFEAVDMTQDRALAGAALGAPFAVVRSYMAHHQGMALVALGNYLNRRSMVDRFHAEPLVEMAETLLNEQAPHAGLVAPARRDEAGTAPATTPMPAGAAAPHWSSTERDGPRIRLLSNGRLTTLLTASGAGGLRWHGMAITRYQPDPTHDTDGLWLHMRDEATWRTWLATSEEGRNNHAMHKAELHLRHEGISAHVEVAVAAVDDVELRLVTLHNETDTRRSLTLTSAARPELFDVAKASTHPAFSSMFIESEWLADPGALAFRRRPQTPEESSPFLVHRLVRGDERVTLASYESDRSALWPRGAGCSAPPNVPIGSADRQPHAGRVGTVLDPVMSITARIDLEAKGAVSFAFVTSVAVTRRAAIDLARKYDTLHAVRWSFVDAEQESTRASRRTRLPPELLPIAHRLFSALVFADRSLAASAEARAADPPSQPQLWGRGVSGDDPIVVVRVRSPDATLIPELLGVQRYLRSCGVRFDVVFVDHHASGYLTEGVGTLRGALALHGGEEWRERGGGIFVLTADQVPEHEVRHLEACARVLLDTRDGGLAAHLDRIVATPPRLPPFEPMLAEDVDHVPLPPVALQARNGVGGFSEDGREYVIDVEPGGGTPAPWCNVIANAELGCLVSESSLGTTWSLNSGENRLTPWRNDALTDAPSEVLYLRDEETAAVWSPTPLPAGREEHVRVRHGAGYTIYEQESHGLRQELTVFVAVDQPIKVARLRLVNTADRRRRVTATYYAEWVLGSRRERQLPYIVSELSRADACLMATCHWAPELGGRVAYLAASDAMHGCTTDRTELLGKRGDYAKPAALERWGLSGCTDSAADPCAALQVHLELGIGESVETHFLIGQSAGRAEALELVRRFRDPDVVAAAWSKLQVWWDDVLGNVRVKTPEPAMDLMLNRWLLYQTLASRIYARTAFYQSSGAFGYRDQLQDVLALLHAAPAVARAHILRAARHQFEEGDVLHWWHPPSGRGVRTRCSDDMAWLPYVTGDYVAATGDLSILEEQVGFLAGRELQADEHDRYDHHGASPIVASLFEHCRRALERAVTVGAHGLPLMGGGDWNDGMSRVGVEGRGESVWLGWFLSATMDRFADLSLRKGADVEARTWRERARALRATTDEVSWDGAWYLRAFHDDGSLVGSATSPECTIDSIAQSWAALSGDDDVVARRERARAAVLAADDRLVREDDRLVLLLWPPFESAQHDPGYVRAYPRGVRENGGQYTHAAAWLGAAHAALGDGARAERIFRLLNPVLRTGTADDVARYRAEPYVLAGDVYSCTPWVGRSGWTWYTGSSAWTWRLGVESILGLRRDGGGLRIEPCIPPSWEGFEAWVHLGGQLLHIVVENPDRVSTGVAAVTLDGVEGPPQRIPAIPGGVGTREVRVRMGTTAPHGSCPFEEVAATGVESPDAVESAERPVNVMESEVRAGP
jgi:cyclic beta-1,2-glucan synthetase